MTAEGTDSRGTYLFYLPRRFVSKCNPRWRMDRRDLFWDIERTSNHNVTDAIAQRGVQLQSEVILSSLRLPVAAADLIDAWKLVKRWTVVKSTSLQLALQL
jgi:hypothetical protein